MSTTEHPPRGSLLTRRPVTVAVAGLAAVGLTVGGITAVQATNTAAPVEDGSQVAQENPVDGTAVEVDQQGHVAKDQGETGGLATDEGDALFEITVDEVTASETCPARVGGQQLTSEHGVFLSLHVTASMDQALQQEVGGDAEDNFLPLMPEAFTVTSPSGETTEAVTSDVSWGCYEDDVLAPAVVNPGETAEGIVVLDVPHDSGTVSYDPDRTGGWSWTYGDAAGTAETTADETTTEETR